VPTSLSLVKAPPTILQQGTGLQHGFKPGYYGIEIDIVYQVLDQNSLPIASATTGPQENVSGLTNGWKDIGGTTDPNYPQSAKFTRPDGIFDDVPLGTCPPVLRRAPSTLTGKEYIRTLYGCGIRQNTKPRTTREFYLWQHVLSASAAGTPAALGR